MTEREYQPQRFPIIYPGSAEFRVEDGPGAVRGATATITITINTRPHMLTGIRLCNVYEVPEELRDVSSLAWLNRLDQEQDLSTQLAQQNVVVRPTMQSLVTGGGGGIGAATVHWHPFECPYPFRGGNNITLSLSRLTSYPDEIKSVTVKAALVGWAYIDGPLPPPGPPSTGFPTG